MRRVSGIIIQGPLDLTAPLVPHGARRCTAPWVALSWVVLSEVHLSPQCSPTEMQRRGHAYILPRGGLDCIATCWTPLVAEIGMKGKKRVTTICLSESHKERQRATPEATPCAPRPGATRKQFAEHFQEARAERGAVR